MAVLAGKVALVTGGGSGIGAHYCQGLAAAGAAVIVADIDLALAEGVAAAIAGDGGTAMAVAVDVADAARVAEMAARVEDCFGTLDILVNNAGLFLTIPLRPFWEIPAAEWDRLLAVNMKGVALVTAALLPLMRKQGYGKVINVASGTPLKGLPGRMHYVASKGGVIAMTRVMARELGPFDIRVNCIAPGQVVTDNYRRVQTEDYFQQAISSRALKRLETPEDLVGTVVFLASPASDFITGQTLVVDGGSAMV